MVALLLVANVVNLGADLQLDVGPEPLLAPPKDKEWQVLWSSEAVEYGGGGVTPMSDSAWRIPGEAAMVFRCC